MQWQRGSKTTQCKKNCGISLGFLMVDVQPILQVESFPGIQPNSNSLLVDPNITLLTLAFQRSLIRGINKQKKAWFAKDTI